MRLTIFQSKLQRIPQEILHISPQITQKSRKYQAILYLLVGYLVLTRLWTDLLGTVIPLENINLDWERHVQEFTLTASRTQYKNLSGDRPLILYSYYETINARINAVFFIRHGLHSAADFIFIINGESNISDLLPPNAPNIKVVHRKNECFDIGSFGDVLLANNKELLKKYTKFILMNASIRGPFLPKWSSDCWSDLYLQKITSEVKLVGMTYNCFPARHVQSMILATDNIGMQILMGENSNSSQGLSGCYIEKVDAIRTELSLSRMIEDATYKYDVMMTGTASSSDYFHECAHEDVNWDKHYFGFNLHPYETIFVKANRRIDPVLLMTLTEWHNNQNYSSWGMCAQS